MKNCLLLLTLLFAQHSFAQAQEHPWPSYANVNDIDAVAKSLRKKFAAQGRYSFSRSWWKWDRLRARYVDSRRTNHNELRILRAVFRGLMLDWHNKLKRKGEGKLLYIFFTTVRGDKRERLLNVGGKRLLRDIHGGGYHGGWGGAARMRLFEELVRGKMLTPQEQAQFKEIVYQSLERRQFFKWGSYQKNPVHRPRGPCGVPTAEGHQRAKCREPRHDRHCPST